MTSSLLGRGPECAFLDAALVDARQGHSRVVVLRGEAGIGKTALLDHLSRQLDGWTVARAVGVEDEAELAYSGLHQICAGMLEELEHLPSPQRDALSTVFGLTASEVPGRFLVGLSVLTLFAEIAERQPLAIVIDDAQWLDQESAEVIAFVARRLLAERIVIVGAARTGVGDDVLRGLPELTVGGLDDNDARSLILGALPGPVDAAALEQIILESHGNPLALIEFRQASTTVDFAGGYGVISSGGLAQRIEGTYARRIDALDEETRLLLLLAAAEPRGDRVVLGRAATVLGVDMERLEPAVDAGLIELGSQVSFTHPLVRSAAYYSVAPDTRYLVHAALAEATDHQHDPDRHAWNRARATSVAEEETAVELEQSAARAEARGGTVAAAAFLQRAFELTADPDRFVERALAAAEACFHAGQFDASRKLLSAAEAHPLYGFDRARALLVRGQLALVLDWGDGAAQLLLEAANELQPFDFELARNAYLTAFASAFHAAHLGPEDVVLAIGKAVEQLPLPDGDADAKGLLLAGLTRMPYGLAGATPILERATRALAEIADQDLLRWGWMAAMAPTAIWDRDAKKACLERQLNVGRAQGALPELPSMLHGVAKDRALDGDFVGARLAIEESDFVAAATGIPYPPYGDLRLLALEGREADALALITSTIEQATARKQGLVCRDAWWAAAILYNGLARYEEAVAAAREVCAHDIHRYPEAWVLPELVEAASRTGEYELARTASERLLDATQAAGTDWALGIRARTQALVSEDAAAERHYREAVARFGKTTLRPELARAHLLYGEWLRRQGRRTDARDQLHTAYEMFAEIGMQAFADRTQRELAATGEKVRRRGLELRDQLTAQEAQIARLARDGHTNREIAGTLFLSNRTVEWHLRKVFMKLGISSRNQLKEALPDRMASVV